VASLLGAAAAGKIRNLCSSYGLLLALSLLLLLLQLHQLLHACSLLLCQPDLWRQQQRCRHTQQAVPSAPSPAGQMVLAYCCSAVLKHLQAPTPLLLLLVVLQVLRAPHLFALALAVASDGRLLFLQGLPTVAVVLAAAVVLC
jgi:hypothetical protein